MTYLVCLVCWRVLYTRSHRQRNLSLDVMSVLIKMEKEVGDYEYIFTNRMEWTFLTSGLYSLKRV